MEVSNEEFYDQEESDTWESTRPTQADETADGYYTGKSSQTDSPSTGNGGAGYRDTADWLLKLGTTGLNTYQHWDDKPAPTPQRSSGGAPPQNWMKNPAVIGGAILGVVLLIVLLKRK